MGDLIPDWAIFVVIGLLVALAVGLLVAEVSASRRSKRGTGSDL